MTLFLSRRGVVGALASTGLLPGVAVSDAAPPSHPFRIVAHDPAFARLIDPSVKLETIATFPRLRGEGPIWRGDELWFSEMRENQVIAVSRGGATRVVAQQAGGAIDPQKPTLQGPNGIANWRGGSVLLCRQGARDIGVLWPDGRTQSLIADYQGKRFNSPNDIVVGRGDSLWFTDPPFALPGHPWGRPADPSAPPPAEPIKPDQQIPFSGVFRLKDGALTAVVTDMSAPNGLAFSPDGKTLYINNARPQMYVRAYAVGPDGALSKPRELIRLPADTPDDRGVFDGLKVDVEGNLWMCGPGGIYVLAPSGKLLGQIQLPLRSTNLTFGDDDKSLFIVSNPNILRLRTRVRGLIPPYSDLKA